MKITKTKDSIRISWILSLWKYRLEFMVFQGLITGQSYSITLWTQTPTLEK